MNDQAYIVNALRTSLADLAREVERLPEAAADWRPAETEWSQRQCLLHIYVCERHIFLPRLQAVAERNHPVLPVIDEHALLQAEAAKAPTRSGLLAEIAADRQAELAVLDQTDWSRTGLHAARGPITLGWLAHYTLAHTLEHFSQIMRVRLAYETTLAQPR
jgi:hypothetical protein